MSRCLKKKNKESKKQGFSISAEKNWGENV